ncbi:MAG: hypothetical protein COZ18_13930, partial [Flexibacter sp. CG_4_10_14_3_um_filter_32_15]
IKFIFEVLQRLRCAATENQILKNVTHVVIYKAPYSVVKDNLPSLQNSISKQILKIFLQNNILKMSVLAK